MILKSMTSARKYRNEIEFNASRYIFLNLNRNLNREKYYGEINR